jgi:8-amino-7-oxononanoate synthase
LISKSQGIRSRKFHCAISSIRNGFDFNSGYDANVGFSSIPQGDLILFDELCHASIRDGIRLSNAQSYKFAHNDFENLELLIERHANTTIVTESVFSMDGDTQILKS